MPHATIVSCLEILAEDLGTFTTGWMAVQDLITDLNRAHAAESFDEDAYFAALEAEWANKEALGLHDAADRYMFASAA
jgi:hypothetical protein